MAPHPTVSAGAAPTPRYSTRRTTAITTITTAAAAAGSSTASRPSNYLKETTSQEQPRKIVEKKAVKPAWGASKKTPAVTEQTLQTPARSSYLLSKPSMASKFLTATNSIRKMTAPALNRIASFSASREDVSSLGDGADREAIQAYLRIRPAPSEERVAQPYLSMQSETEVIMKAPFDPARPQVQKPSQSYKFSKIFPAETTQEDYFKLTAQPLVQSLLNGDNGLIFAYGVTNSGKTYTIQGGAGASESERGVIPRVVDVIFNSVEGLQTEANIRPYNLASVEVLSKGTDSGFVKASKFVDRASKVSPIVAQTGDDGALSVDRNYSYAVFISYCEVYNDKIYDLLEALPVISSNSSSSTLNHHLPSSSSIGGSSSVLPTLSSSSHNIVKRKALSLKTDSEVGAKYISGLQDVRVRTREEAQAVLSVGQVNRQVFSTLSNKESSRSHGVFTVKIVKIHNGAPFDEDSMLTSRLSIVDLAGSERTKNTQNTGERLKEAGNINKSLMVLGQCMEVLKENQKKASISRKPAIVPFRHSKLTEMFQTFFMGEGRAVMMIHINPFDTGFDENSNVMKFSAVARDVVTITHTIHHAPAPRVLGTIKRSDVFSATPSRQSSSAAPASGRSTPVQMTRPASGIPRSTLKAPGTPVASLSTTGTVITISSVAEQMDTITPVVSPEDDELVVIEEETPDDEDDVKDALVEHLFDQIKELRTELFNAELRAATIEAEVREEITADMSKRMVEMEKLFSQSLQRNSEMHEMKTNKQIDILQGYKPQAMFTPFPQAPVAIEDQEEEEDGYDDEVDQSLLLDENEENSGFIEVSEPPSPSPLGVAFGVSQTFVGLSHVSVSQSLVSAKTASSPGASTIFGDADESDVVEVAHNGSEIAEERESVEDKVGGEEEDSGQDEENEDSDLDSSEAADSSNDSFRVESFSSSADSTPIKPSRRVSRLDPSSGMAQEQSSSPKQKIIAESLEEAVLDVAPTGPTTKLKEQREVSQPYEMEEDGDVDVKVHRKALQDSLVQGTQHVPIIVEADPSKKKKRKLGGKKIMNEDEIAEFAVATSGKTPVRLARLS